QRIGLPQFAGTIQILPLSAGKNAPVACTELTGDKSVLRFSPDGRYLAVSGSELIQVWKADRGGPPWYVVKGDRFAWAGGERLVVAGNDDTIRVLDVQKKT